MTGRPSSSLFLALDTSFEKGSLGLFRWKEAPPLQKEKKNRPDRKIFREGSGSASIIPIHFREWSVQKKPFLSHSEKLLPEMLSVFREAGEELSRLRFLAVSTGPGRFTGVRTAVNAARALSFALNIPCYPFHSLRLTAEGFLTESPIITVAFNSFKNSVYFAEFSSSGKEQTALCTLPFPQYLERMEGKTLCVGDVPPFLQGALLPQKIL